MNSVGEVQNMLRTQSHRILHWLAAWVLVCLVGCGQQDLSQRPDILLITIDTLRADRIGCYGYTAAATPTMDRLAAEGTRYDYCVAPAPITLPSHAAIMTGQLPARLGVRNNGTYRLGSQPPTLAEVLAQNGYLTGAFVAALPVASQFGLDRGFVHYDDELPAQGSGLFRYAERPADAVVQAALAWLGGQKRQGPVFLWVHFFEPHAPYTPPPAFERAFAERPYDGEVAATDAALAELLAGCRRLRPDNWLTVLTSDHGEGLGEHGEQTHAFFLYESTLRVPLILHAPGEVPAGEVISEPVGLIDLAPTILELAGSDDRRLIPDGIALDPRRQPPRRDLVSETLAGMEGCGWSPAFSLRHGTQKVIRSARSRAFDLATDPGEQQNLLTAESPSWTDSLLVRVTRFIAGLDTLPPQDEVTRQLTAAERQKLLALGYVVGSADAGASSSPGSDMLQRMAELPDAEDRITAQANVEKAQELIRNADYLDAVALLEPVLTENSLNANARSLLAGCFRALERQPEAIAQYTLLVQQLPRRLEPRINLARVLSATNRPLAAVEHYKAAISLDPGNMSLLREAVVFFVQYRQYDPALAALADAAARLDLTAREQAFLHEAHARIHLARGEPGRGVDHLDQARAIANGPDLQILAVQYAAASEDWQGVKDLLSTAIPAVKLHPTCQVLMARAQAELGERAAGLAALRACLRQDPAWAGAHAELAQLLSQDSARDEALSHARRAVELAPGTPAYHLTYLELLLGAQRFKEAASHAERALQTFPNHAGIRSLAVQLRDQKK
jgi:arylsulfatase A-like enzyme/tetratricopeptide (TPR) repeat protein